MSTDQLALTISEVWAPTQGQADASRILTFARSVGCVDVPGLLAYAEADPTRYWGEVAAWLDLDWQVEPGATVVDLDKGPAARWFPGGAFNLADACVDRWVRRGRGADMALRWELEDGSRGAWTYAELAAQVDALCHGLVGLGVRPGDRVGLQLPMVREAAVAALACAKLGAVCVPVFSGFGGEAVAQRLAYAEVAVHIVASAFPRRGRQVSLRAGLGEALASVPTLTGTVVLGPPADAAHSPGSPDRLPGEVGWDEVIAEHLGRRFEAFITPSDHPLMIAFTSGSTGRPKGIVLGHVGFAVKAGSDAAFSFDLGQGDTAAWITDPGWVMSPITLFGGLLNGAAVALYAGTPDWPDGQRIWDFAQGNEVTMLGVSPTLVRLLMARADGLPHGAGAVRVLASSGEPWTPDAYRWLYADAFGGAVPIVNYSGGTEVSGGILSNTLAQPIHPCAFAGPLPGMGADVVSDSGSSLSTGVGELALRHASPGMPLTFWRDDDRYRENYWTRWEGLWHHGDWAERTADGIWYIRGRSDDTLKVAGKRVGPSEVESVVNAVPGIVESAAVGVPHPTKGDALVVFARHDGRPDDLGALGQAIADAVADAMGRPLRPQQVHVVTALPRTRSGKILRRLVRAAYLGEPYGDVSALEDESAVGVIEATR